MFFCVYVVDGVNMWVDEGVSGLHGLVGWPVVVKKKPDPARPAGRSTGFGLPAFSGTRSHLYLYGVVLFNIDVICVRVVLFLVFLVSYTRRRLLLVQVVSLTCHLLGSVTVLVLNSWTIRCRRSAVKKSISTQKYF